MMIIFETHRAMLDRNKMKKEKKNNTKQKHEEKEITK